MGQELRDQCSRTRKKSYPFVSHWLGEVTVVPGPASACRAQYTVRQRNNEEHETAKKNIVAECKAGSVLRSMLTLSVLDMFVRRLVNGMQKQRSSCLMW